MINKHLIFVCGIKRLSLQIKTRPFPRLGRVLQYILYSPFGGKGGTEIQIDILNACDNQIPHP